MLSSEKVNFSKKELLSLENILKNNSSFINDFVNKKLDDLCFHLALFFNYLSFPRNNFKKVDDKILKSLSDEQVNVQEDINSYIKIRPYITLKMSYYLLTEIYGCKDITSSINKDNYDLYDKIIYNTVVNSNKKEVNKRIIDHVIKLSDDRFNEKNLIVDENIKELLYKYVVNIIKCIIKLDDEGQILPEVSLKNNYEKLEKYLIIYKRTFNNKFENDEIKNITFNSFLSLIIPLLDWLGINEVDLVEVNTALNLILTEEMRGIYKEWVEEYYNHIEDLKENNKIDEFNSYFNQCISQIIYIFKKYDLGISIRTSEQLIKHIYILSNKINKNLIEKKEEDIIDNFINIFKGLF
jgi:hypothetical protein